MDGLFDEVWLLLWGGGRGGLRDQSDGEGDGG